MSSKKFDKFGTSTRQHSTCKMHAYKPIELKRNISKRMFSKGNVVPRIGSSVWGSVGVNVVLLRAELRLTGYLLTASYPTTLTVEFRKFPLRVR